VSGALFSVVWFLGLVSIQITGRALAFFFLRLIEIAAMLLPSFLKKVVFMTDKRQKFKMVNLHLWKPTLKKQKSACYMCIDTPFDGIMYLNIRWSLAE